MATAARTYCTPEEYLAFERRSEFRHEYIDGRIVAMTGGTRAHSLVRGKLSYYILQHLLKGSACEVHGPELRVKIGLGPRYVYPDVAVTCEPEFEDGVHDTLVNPVFVAEVLSPSTERYDRGDKKEHYRAIPTLQEYCIIWQDRPRVECYSRNGEFWPVTVATSLDETITLSSIGCTVSLRDLYVGVEFASPPSAGARPNALPVEPPIDPSRGSA